MKAAKDMNRPLKHGFLFVKTCILIAYDIDIYAIRYITSISRIYFRIKEIFTDWLFNIANYWELVMWNKPMKLCYIIVI